MLNQILLGTSCIPSSTAQTRVSQSDDAIHIEWLVTMRREICGEAKKYMGKLNLYEKYRRNAGVLYLRSKSESSGSAIGYEGLRRRHSEAVKVVDEFATSRSSGFQDSCRSVTIWSWLQARQVQPLYSVRQKIFSGSRHRPNGQLIVQKKKTKNSCQGVLSLL